MKINIMETYKESFRNVRTHKRQWLKVATGPLVVWGVGFLLLLTAMISSGYLFGAFYLLLKDYIQIEEVPRETVFFTVAHIIYNILFFVAMLSLELNGYRYAVLEETGDHFVNVTLNRRFLRFIIYMVLFQVLAGVYLTVSIGFVAGANSLLANDLLSTVLCVFLFFLGFYLMYRLSLFSILVSIDQGQPFKTSWRLMKGNVLRLIGLSILVGLKIFFIGILVGLFLALIWFVLAMPIDLFGVLTKSVILKSRIVLGVSLALLWVLFLVLYSWAVNSKVMGLVYQRLSDQKKA